MTDGYRIEIELEGVPPLNSADAANRWQRKKSKDLWHVAINLAIGNDKPQAPLSAAKVTITRCTSSAPDGDNLVASAKFLLDALQAAQVIDSDKPQCIGMPTVHWERAAPGKKMTRIYVEECWADELDLSAWDWRR